MLLLLLGMLVSVAVYWRVNRKVPVLQVVRDVPAGQQVAADDLGQLRIAADGPFATIPAGDAGSVVGLWAKVRLVAGSLVTRDQLQATSLVAPGHAVVAVRVPVGELPVGLRERSRLQIVVAAPTVAASSGGAAVLLPVIDATAVAMPSTPEPGGATVSLSVELSVDDAARVAAAERIRLLLIAPGAP